MKRKPAQRVRLLAPLLLLLCLIMAVSPLLAAPPTEGEPTAVVATGALNVRSGPGIAYSPVAATYQGHVVALLGRNNAASWAKVRLFSGQIGWVNARYLIDPTVAISSLPVADAPTLTAVATVATGALNIRSGPGVAYPATAVAPYGAQVALLGRNNAASWAKVRLANGHEGWLNVTLVTANVAISSLPVLTAPAPTAVATVATGALNVRSGPGVAYPSTAIIYQGLQVRLLGRNNNSTWVKIRLGTGHEGWVNASLVTPNVMISSLPALDAPGVTPTAVIATGALNVRSGPGVAYPATSVTYQGHTVTLLGRNNAASWVKIRLANGHVGWVNASLVTPNVAISNLPVVAADTVVASATVATYALNMRYGPSVNYNILAVLRQGDSAALVGRNSAGTWVQLRLANGVTGWVNAAYLHVNVAISSLPITG